MNGPEMGSVFDVSKWGKLRTSCRHQEAHREGRREGGTEGGRDGGREGRRDGGREGGRCKEYRELYVVYL